VTVISITPLKLDYRQPLYKSFVDHEDVDSMFVFCAITPLSGDTRQLHVNHPKRHLLFIIHTFVHTSVCFLFFVCSVFPSWFFLWLHEEVLTLLFFLHHENGDSSILMKDILIIHMTVDYIMSVVCYCNSGLPWKTAFPISFSISVFVSEIRIWWNDISQYTYHVENMEIIVNFIT
jgi:hypothetical protein